MAQPQVNLSDLSLPEVIQLGAVSPSFFNSSFLPRTFPLSPPPFQSDACEMLNSPGRLKALKMFRGGSKTSIVRSHLLRRIAYGVTNLSLVVSETQGHSVKSLNWLARQILFNKKLTQVYGLEKGTKWAENDELEIINRKFDTVTRVAGLGITGQVRGFNFDDNRPDLILLDDPCNEENTGTKDQRRKTNDLILGALVNGLAAPATHPHASLIMCQTPLHKEDAIETATIDPAWETITYGCFKEDGTSQWEDLFPTEWLLKQKATYSARNQLSLWLREMECKVVSSETAAFRAEWLVMDNLIPEEGFTLMSIDPTPPPVNAAGTQTVGYLERLDDAAVCVIKVKGRDVFLAEYYITKSPNTREFLYKIFDLYTRWRPLFVGVETVNYQRSLKEAIEQEMQNTGIFFPVVPYESKRKKGMRIMQEITNRAYNRSVHVHPDMHEFINQYTEFPNSEHDDLLDAFSICLAILNKMVYGGEELENALAPPSSALDGFSPPSLQRASESAFRNWRGAP